ncbi:MAG TPA: ATP-binding protein [Candidatus Acidoferrum sp.]|nr:ATP-binding protein [Candidatus Acidoferrum sp.]
MRAPARDKRKRPADFLKDYQSALMEFIASGDETALGKAYELGRRGLSERLSLVEIAAMHHKSLAILLKASEPGQPLHEAFKASEGFLAECLSPYEMAHLGFQDAVKALRQLNETLEEKLKSIAYAVHDEAGQLLIAVHLALAELALGLPPEQLTQVEKVRELLQEVEKHLRRYSHELRPTILDDLGWLPAIRFLAEGVSKRADLPIQIESEITGRLPSPMETALYRTVQEALNNTVKHAKARNVWIRAWRNKSTLHCSVRDDGVGFDMRVAQIAGEGKGLGLIAMRERLSAVGGTLHIHSHLGKGTELSIQVPLEGYHANPSRSRG